MGLEGGPEGPEDPIAQICISLGTVCAMGTTVVSMKDVFKAAKWHDCYKCGGTWAWDETNKFYLSLKEQILYRIIFTTDN
mmetsp:Transcript_2564/g.7899  ORF Transcript_2564/g.7899 Transcript_2564/m.7899 type:complete len:80 (-) Transcript_2564:157-396(-)